MPVRPDLWADGLWHEGMSRAACQARSAFIRRKRFCLIARVPHCRTAAPLPGAHAGVWPGLPQPAGAVRAETWAFSVGGACSPWFAVCPSASRFVLCQNICSKHSRLSRLCQASHRCLQRAPPRLPEQGTALHPPDQSRGFRARLSVSLRSVTPVASLPRPSRTSSTR